MLCRLQFYRPFKSVFVSYRKENIPNEYELWGSIRKFHKMLLFWHFETPVFQCMQFSTIWVSARNFRIFASASSERVVYSVLPKGGESSHRQIRHPFFPTFCLTFKQGISVKSIKEIPTVFKRIILAQFENQA